jgi:RNA polymerase sigma factor (sigma-70 family)
LSASVELRPLLVENLRDMPDEDLLKSCLGPSAVAKDWEELVYRIQKYSRGVVFRVLQNAGRGENGVDDVIQDLLEKLTEDNYRRLHEFKFQHKNSLKAFVSSVARNMTIDLLRPLKNKPHQELPDLPDSRPGPERTLLINEIFAYVQANTTPSEYDIFLLHYREGFSAPEISKWPGINRELKEIEYAIWKIMRMLKNKYGDN